LKKFSEKGVPNAPAFEGGADKTLANVILSCQVLSVRSEYKERRAARHEGEGDLLASVGKGTDN